MKKFENLEDLAKAAGSLAGTLVKNADFHKAAAGLHSAHAAHHGEMAAFHKGLHDALDDGHEDKAYHKKMADHHDVTKAHHTALHEVHKGYAGDAEKLAGVFDLQKADGTPAPTATPKPAATGVDGVFDATINKILEKTLGTIEESPAVAAAIEKAILAKFNERFGNTIVPDGVRVNTAQQPPADVLAHLQLIPRVGASSGLEKATVDPGMEDALAI